MATRDLDRLAARVKAHRLELFPSRKAAADTAGISKDTWQRVEEGQEVRENTYAKIDRVLGWAIGSCIAITEGGEPTLVDADADSSAAVPLERLSAEAVRQAAWEAARAKLPGAPIGDIDAFSDELVEVLRRAGQVADDD
jgi:DNA-binding XRE family transcriptional regulator